jgi:hypothetical protein
MVSTRPERKQRIRSGRVPVRTGRGHNDFHCFNSRSPCHRMRDPVATTSAVQTAARTVVIDHPYCHQWRDAGVGRRPVWRAVSYARRRRCSTTSAGKREANNRHGKRRGPRETARSTTAWAAAVGWTWSTRARAGAADSAEADTATRGLTRLRNQASVVAICGKAATRQYPQSRMTRSPARRNATIVAACP